MGGNKMRIVKMKDAGRNSTYQWPQGLEKYDYFVEYEALAEDGRHTIKIGFCERFTYGRNRIRVIIWIDEHPHAEFFGADDYENSGEVLSEIKVPGDKKAIKPRLREIFGTGDRYPTSKPKSFLK